MEHTFEQRLERLERDNGNLKAGLRLLGMQFCDVCGRPHANAMGGSSQSTSMLLKLSNGHARVCSDVPGLKCLNYVFGGETNGFSSVFKFESDFAKWILVNKAFLASSPMNSDVRKLVSEGLILNRDELAFHMVYWQTLPYLSKDVENINEYDMLNNCGLNMSRMGIHALLSKCADFATAKKHDGQKNYFSSKVNKLSNSDNLGKVCKVTIENAWGIGRA